MVTNSTNLYTIPEYLLEINLIKTTKTLFDCSKSPTALRFIIITNFINYNIIPLGIELNFLCSRSKLNLSNLFFRTINKKTRYGWKVSKALPYIMRLFWPANS